jgi:hypothetical protein
LLEGGVMAATKQRPPDYVAPDDQQALLDKLAELKSARGAIGPGAGKVYREDVHAFADRVFADLAAEAARQKAFRLAELRQLLTLELESGQDVLTLDHVDGLDPGEVHAIIDAGAPAGYTDLVSERPKAQDEEAARKLDAEIGRTKARLALLEAREERKRSDERIAELEASANGEAGCGVSGDVEPTDEPEDVVYDDRAYGVITVTGKGEDEYTPPGRDEGGDDPGGDE